MDDIGTQRSSARKPWTLWLALGVAALVAASALVYVVSREASKPAGSGFERYAAGSLGKLTVLDDAPAQPGETIWDAEGAPHTLADLRGGFVLVNFWATWCAPCLVEMPTLAALETRYADNPRFRVVPVSVDTEAKAAEARAMLAELSGGVLPFYIEPTRRIPISAGAGGLPTSILYDPQGREIARLAGSAEWDSPEALALIEAALAAEHGG